VPPSCYFFLLFQLGGFDWFIVSNRCITEVAIVLLLILQPVNYTSNIVAGAVAFLSRFCLQSVNCRSSNYNHAEVVIVLVRRSLIDSLLATAILQKLQSPYFWSCNRSSRHNYTVFVGVVTFFVAFFCNRLIVGVSTIITAEVVIVVLDRNFFTYIFFCVAVWYCENCILFLIGCKYLHLQELQLCLVLNILLVALAVFLLLVL
jgi:hypothetical protein